MKSTPPSGPPAAHPDHLPATRYALRKRLRAQRRALPPAQQHAAAEGLARLLGHSGLFRRSRHIAFYVANDGELDPMPLMRRAWAMGKVCYLPVIAPDQRLWFAPYAHDDQLITNRYGIPEPAAPALTGARHLDLILAPLVGFDERGRRLGMGGGFYDRTLAFLRHRRAWRKPRLIGIAHDLQRVARLESAPWDVPMDAVATDSALYLFCNNRA